MRLFTLSFINYQMTKPLMLLALLPTAALARQAAPVASAAPRAWSGGFGAGNGLELHVGRWESRFIAFGRVRGKWWGPTTGPTADWFGSNLNTRSRQVEAAALVGYPLAVGPLTLYAATGVAYVNGRQLGEYRFTLRTSGALSDATHYYSYRDYQAVGWPLDVGILSPRFGAEKARAGLSFQANLNPQHSVFCLLATFWIGDK